MRGGEVKRSGGSGYMVERLREGKVEKKEQSVIYTTVTEITEFYVSLFDFIFIYNLILN